ncbi:kinase-like domain-containing protein [Aspergillus karnatakaensis]|uniref:kinase-like domain-containing protein n=1 Tax=Aspergillus karnatakaensis TaxID=1810916 RepID=UPI003CCCC69C
MEIIQKNESFKKRDGKMQFAYVRIFARQKGILYSGKWSDRFTSPKTLEDLQDLEQIPTKDRGPKINPGWSGVYIKTPSLLSYIDGDLEKRIAREIKICEILRRNPHPNIAVYFGCTETNGRVSGLAFKQYTATLLETVNPQRLNKGAFRSSVRELVTEGILHGLAGILSAIKHFHSLGLVHNDINPANIMLDQDGTLILIDFDSCRYIGESLRSTETKRTHQWHDASVDISMEKNDLDAFEDLQEWLVGSGNERFPSE